MTFFNKFFKRKIKNNPESMKMAFSPVQAEKMLHMIQLSQEVELSCDEVHDLLDQYAEMVIRGENVANLLPLAHYHLEMCPDCREEFEALSLILQAQQKIDFTAKMTG